VHPRQQRILSDMSGVDREGEEEDMGALIQDPDESGRQRGFRRNATMSMYFSSQVSKSIAFPDQNRGFYGMRIQSTTINDPGSHRPDAGCCKD
jgi:hypothetical protein